MVQIAGILNANVIIVSINNKADEVHIMKIIEYGHIKPKEVKCNHCGAVLEYVPNDFQHWTYEKYYLICPVCRGNILRDNDGHYFER